MTKKLPKNTDKELLERAGTGPKGIPDDWDPDYSITAKNMVNAIPASEHRAWFESRGLPVPEEYLEGYDPHDRYEHLDDWVEDKQFNAVRIISPKNAKYSD